jgi:hypothetical protein
MSFTPALTALRDCRSSLLAAHHHTLAATAHLAGARQARAVELAEKLGDAIAHAERLAVVVEGRPTRRGGNRAAGDR